MAIFKEHGYSKTRGYAALKESDESTAPQRCFPHRSEDTETRGESRKLDEQGVHKMIDIIESKPTAKERNIAPDLLAYEANVDVHERTIQRRLHEHQYFRCIACRKGYIDKDLREHRVAWAQHMLAKYPTPEHWKHVRFSDEVHFGLGPQGRLWIWRKRGDRYCNSCIQYEDNPNELDKKKLHAWAAVGYNFKSDLVFYNIPTNTNGKMTLQDYEHQILEPIVKPWLDKKEEFVLEEDQDSGHGTGKINNVKRWKERHGLKSYFNCSGSPDLSPIENCFCPIKSYIRSFKHWEIETTKELAQEAWYHVLKQESIDAWVLSMPERLQAVIDSEGHLIADIANKKHHD